MIAKALISPMSCARNRTLALVVCCGVASLGAGDALAQGMTPLRVDPVLLGLPPVEKKPPATVKPSEPPPERVRAEVKPVEAQPQVGVVTDESGAAVTVGSLTGSAAKEKDQGEDRDEDEPAKQPAALVPAGEMADGQGQVLGHRARLLSQYGHLKNTERNIRE